ncbi:hypothetical protein OG226_00890 [Streptomyces sp. NBC_01261]|uniref:hypothetical protein n=1 Tax=Streptomyces sp. NBC_01261 TaxID=2903802 RepID=UPI002E31927F|nr:hypothetical protein [Streptomyces sp. NBC_01261]
MTDDKDAAAGGAGPFLRQYAPTGRYRHVGADRASVLFYRNGGYSVVTISGTQHVDKRPLARPYTVCEIALGTFLTTIRMELPAAGATAFFKAEVDIQWAVTDPYLVAVEVVTDVGKRLTTPVLERLREVTSTYGAAEAERANRAVLRECADDRWDDLGAELGLRVQLNVRLEVDSRTVELRDNRGTTQGQAEQLIRGREDAPWLIRQSLEGEQLGYLLNAYDEGARDFLEKVRQEGRSDEKERVDHLYAKALRGDLSSADLGAQVLSLLTEDGHRPDQGPTGSVPVHRDPSRPESAREGTAVQDTVSLAEIEWCGDLIVAALSAREHRLRDRTRSLTTTAMVSAKAEQAHAGCGVCRGDTSGARSQAEAAALDRQEAIDGSARGPRRPPTRSPTARSCSRTARRTTQGPDREPCRSRPLGRDRQDDQLSRTAPRTWSTSRGPVPRYSTSWRCRWPPTP